MIHLQNYEEWFLLYIDNELTPIQKEMVEQFVWLHPEIRDELEQLKGSVLQDATIKNNDWDFLLKKETTISWEEKALLALDNELNEQQQGEWVNILQENEEARAFYDSLIPTKLIAETIQCPNKETLIRKERRPIVIPIWLRYSSVAAVLTGIVWCAWNQYNPKRIEENIIMTDVSVANKTILDTARPAVQVSKQSNLSHNTVRKVSGDSKREEKTIASSDNVNTQKREMPDKEIFVKTNVDKGIIVSKDIASIETPIEKTMIVPVAVNMINAKTTAVNIDQSSGEAQKVAPPHSGKRMVTLEDAANNNKVFVANTEINTQKLFGWLKRNKFGKSKDNTKKLEIANFEIAVKTNQL